MSGTARPRVRFTPLLVSAAAMVACVPVQAEQTGSVHPASLALAAAGPDFHRRAARVAANTTIAGPWLAGAYLFSDELGGFRIRSISGTGTLKDPVILSQEILTAAPVTLVIRAATTIRPYALAGDFANGFLHLKLVTLNNTGLPWIAFGVELQEILNKPSDYGDGLSFDQRKTGSERITSDAFATFDTSFEPYDRIVYGAGHVDPLGTATFGFLVTDFTPSAEFYILQDPRIPAS